MAAEQPFVLREGPTGELVGVHRPRRAWGGAAFLLVWLVGWFFGEVIALSAVVAAIVGFPEDVELLAFMLVWLPLWTFGGIYAMWEGLFSVAGRYEVTLDTRALTIRRVAWRFGRARRYELEDIGDVRTIPSGDRWIVTFSHAEEAVDIGGRLAERDAEALAATLRERVPPKPPVAPPDHALRRITFTGSRLELRRGFGPVGWTRRYERALVRNVRAVPMETEDGPSRTRFEVAFDYGRTTIRLGGRLTFGEAEALAEHVRDQLLLNVA